MKKNRNIEDIITAIFTVSFLMFLFYGFKYFAGFEYASKVDALIITILAINIFGGVLYFFYRFIKWMVIKIAKFVEFLDNKLDGK